MFASTCARAASWMRAVVSTQCAMDSTPRKGSGKGRACTRSSSRAQGSGQTDARPHDVLRLASLVDSDEQAADAERGGLRHARPTGGRGGSGMVAGVRRSQGRLRLPVRLVSIGIPAFVPTQAREELPTGPAGEQPKREGRDRRRSPPDGQGSVLGTFDTIPGRRAVRGQGSTMNARYDRTRASPRSWPSAPALASFSTPLAADSDEFSSRVVLCLFATQAGGTTTFLGAHAPRRAGRAA